MQYVVPRGRPRPNNPEVVSRKLGSAFWITFQSLLKEQESSFIELSHTEQNRIDLSISLAKSLYQSGLSGLSAKMLQQYLVEGEVQAILFVLICGAREEQLPHFIWKIIKDKPEFKEYARLATHYHERGGAGHIRGLGYDSITTDEWRGREEGGPVPEMSSAERHPRRGAGTIRTTRDLRGTGRRDTRSVS